MRHQFFHICMLACNRMMMSRAMRKRVLCHMRTTKARSLISAFIVRCLDSVMSLVSVTKMSSLMLASVAAQAGLCLALSETPEDTFSHGVAQMQMSPTHNNPRQLEKRQQKNKGKGDKRQKAKGATLSHIEGWPQYGFDNTKHDTVHPGVNKVAEKAMISIRNNRIPRPSPDTIRERNKKSKRHKVTQHKRKAKRSPLSQQMSTRPS